MDAQLDRLNSVLDAIEERNDRIHGQLKDMLKTSRDNRNNVPNDQDSDQSGGPSSSSPAANWWSNKSLKGSRNDFILLDLWSYVFPQIYVIVLEFNPCIYYRILSLIHCHESLQKYKIIKFVVESLWYKSTIC